MILRRRGSFAFSVFLLAIPVYFIVKALEYSPQARVVPLVIAVPTLALQLLVILGHQFPRLLRGFDVDIVAMARRGNPLSLDPAAAAASEARPGHREELRGIMAMTGWMVACFVGLSLVGFLPTLFGFVSLFLLLSGKTRWWAALLAGAGFSAAIWVVFVKGMRLTLFEGVLFGGLLPPL